MSRTEESLLRPNCWLCHSLISTSQIFDFHESKVRPWKCLAIPNDAQRNSVKWYPPHFRTKKRCHAQFPMLNSSPVSAFPDIPFGSSLLGQRVFELLQANSTHWTDEANPLISMETLAQIMWTRLIIIHRRHQPRINRSNPSPIMKQRTGRGGRDELLAKAGHIHRLGHESYGCWTASNLYQHD